MRIEHNGGNEYFFKDVKIKSFLLITNILDIKDGKIKMKIGSLSSSPAWP